MSTILKALRRLEQEKAASTDGRPLREEVAGAVPATEPAPSRRWGLAALGLVLGLAAGGSLFAWMNVDGGDEQPMVAAAAPAPVAVAANPARVEAVAPAPARRPAPDTLPLEPPEPGQRVQNPFGDPRADAFNSPVEVVRRPEALPQLADPSPVQPIQRPKAGQRRPVEDSSAAARVRRALADAAAASSDEVSPRPAAAPVAPAPVAAQPAPAPAPAPRAAPAPAPAPRAAPEPAPAPAPAPTRVAAAEPPPAPAAKPTPKPAPKAAPKVAVASKPALPTLLVEKTLWHPRPERRSAWLRLEGEESSRRVVEGDVVSGLLVAEIEPSGIVLERDGERFTRGLGSSGKR